MCRCLVPCVASSKRLDPSPKTPARRRSERPKVGMAGLSHSGRRCATPVIGEVIKLSNLQCITPKWFDLVDSPISCMEDKAEERPHETNHQSALDSKFEN